MYLRSVQELHLHCGYLTAWLHMRGMLLIYIPYINVPIGRTYADFVALVKDSCNEAGADIPYIRRIARHAYRWMTAYVHGLVGAKADYAVRKSKSHRRIPQSLCPNLG